jgi:hypothetical protein
VTPRNECLAQSDFDLLILPSCRSVYASNVVYNPSTIAAISFLIYSAQIHH